MLDQNQIPHNHKWTHYNKIQVIIVPITTTTIVL